MSLSRAKLRDRSPERLLQATDLCKFFTTKRSTIRAVDDVSLSIYEGETLGLVGESGCGKSTLGRTLLRLYEPTSGTLMFRGEDLLKLTKRELQMKRREMQMILQDSSSALNPRMTIRKLLKEPYDIHKLHSRREREDDLRFLLGKVGLSDDVLDCYPHEFSGGQKQRLCIARALALRPKFIVCDEAVSALDASLRTQILDLMGKLKDEFKLTYLFISHDLAVVEALCDRVAVMYFGKIVESSGTETLFDQPAHPYTKALMASIPIPDPRQRSLDDGQISSLIHGDVPSPTDPPSGCHFHPRCPLATETCKREAPTLCNIGSQQNPHWVSCHRANNKS